MPLDPLYEDSTSTFLAGQNQVNIPDPGSPAPSTSLTSIAKAVGRGIGQGGASLFGAAADTASGLSQVYVDPDSTAGVALNPVEQAAQDKRINEGLAKGKAGTLFQSSAGTAAYNFADTLKPDPTNSTAIDQIVQGAVAGLTQIVPAAVLGGPLAGAAVGGASIGLGASEDLKRKGVDVGTRTTVGALEGTLGGVGAVLPAGGSTLARTAGLVALGGPGFTIAQGTAEKAILRNANYDKLADQINPLDPVNLAASTIVAGAFGGLHTAGAARAAKADGAASTASTAPAASTDTPITAMPVDARKALPYNSPALDSYAQQAAQAAGVPPEMLLFIKNKGERSNSNQVSSAGAKGVMQFTDKTWGAFGNGDPKDPVNSIDAAAAYSADLLKRYDGDVRAAITEYNGGVKQAEAVHAGGKPTDPQTIAYLQRYDEYAANHQISNLKFDPTPEQTDAALVSHSQSLVDDAHIGPADDVAAMSAHQDAFELASRQMDAGEPVNVTSVMPPELARGDVLGNYAKDIGSTLPPIPEPVLGDLIDTRGSGARFHGTSRPIDSLSDEYALSGDNRNIYGQGFYTTDAVDISNGYMKKGRGKSPTLYNVDHENVPLLNMEHPLTPETQKILHDTMGDLLPTENAETGEPLKSMREVMDEYRHQSKYEGLTRDDVQETFDSVRYRLEQLGYKGYEHEGGHGTKNQPHNVKIFWNPESDVRISPADLDSFRKPPEFGKLPPLEEAPDWLSDGQPAAKNGADEVSAPAVASPESPTTTPVEQNVRQAAVDQPDTVVHVDANEGPKEGKIADVLKTIDDEHQATLQDASLLQVAANCFISSGD